MMVIVLYVGHLTKTLFYMRNGALYKLRGKLRKSLQASADLRETLTDGVLLAFHLII